MSPTLPPGGEFISCDWGTTALRLHLVNPVGEAPVASVASREGIAAVHRAWLARGPESPGREGFYLAVVQGQLEQLAKAVGRSLAGLPLVMSGMASGTLGVRALPYRALPFSLDGGDLAWAVLPATPEFPHSWLLISGARVADDVMRGEETQLVGAAVLERAAWADGLVVLPGTHSKHVRVRGGRAIGLRTYMSGEFYDLLVRHTILASSVDPAAACAPEMARQAFAEGVGDGAADNLLHTAFGVRVAEISGHRLAAASHHYLSGLVIGSELGELREGDEPAITLVGSAELVARYRAALEILCPATRLATVAGDAAIIAGQRALAIQAKLLPAFSPPCSHPS
ncbi:MAG TPA: 2-dehydro-3-deoxygalactonokinase [Lacunisphaera sp.]|nr:2-dehydro-3-deoxygalactonokinase [Lacunisphaera sp.]